MAPMQPEPIAIVGSGCRFPGGTKNPSELWELLEKPRDVCVEIPSDRFNITGYYHPDGSHHSTSNVRHSYLIQEDIRAFDCTFFNISPNEAESMDPQQRVLMEAVYEALEAGGHTIEALKGSDTAVYVGTMGVDYNDTLIRDTATIPTYFATGTNRAIMSNRISYFFDWHGPSMTIDTACSSSLIAVHQAVQSLRNGESRISVACGTQIILNPEAFIFESKLNMLSPTGRSRMWDADADGYARGEGVASVILKRLSDAVADGDHIECILRETGTNQDGFSNGITVPNTDAQVALIQKTYRNAGLDPLNNPNDAPQFFEAHGTGTKAGDPKEAAAIAKSFNTNPDAPLYVGSVKTVIGHTEGTAGLAGILKASGIIQKGIIPPNLLFNKLNPGVEPFYIGLEVPTSIKPWPALPEGVPRRVSVNSFGFGGSNAHAILEEYRPSSDVIAESDKTGRPFTPFVFSALSEASLVGQLEAYADHLRNRQDVDLADLAWTLQTRRSQFAFKIAFSASSTEGLVEKIDAKLAAVKQDAGLTLGTRTSHKAHTARVLGVFTGQGAQWPAMGAELIRESAFVEKRVQDLQNSLNELPEDQRPEWDLKSELLAGPDTSRLAEAALSQPLCTAVQIILVDLLKSAGIEFSSVVGHSSGEIAAAYAAGFYSDWDAIRIAYYRGVYAKLAGNPRRGEKGLMMAVGTSLEDAQDLIKLRAFKGKIGIAAHNSEASVTLSGDADTLHHAKRVFDEEKKFARMLKVDTAYHSHHMFPCSEPYVKALQDCGVKVKEDRESTCSWFSSVVPGSSPVEAASLKETYWRDNMVNSVLFADAVKNAVENDPQLTYALEIGPHPALKGPATQNVSEVRPAGIPYSGVLSRGRSDIDSFSETLGFVWTQVGPSLVKLNSYEKLVSGVSSEHNLVVGLPSYRWNHARSYWRESRISRNIRNRKVAFHELLGIPTPDSNARDRRWTNVFKVSEMPWLDGHQLQDQTVFPAAGYCALALEAAKAIAGEDPMQLIELNDLDIPRAITFEDDANFGVEVLTSLTNVRHENGTLTADFSVYSCPINATVMEMETMASGNVKVVFGTQDPDVLSSTPLSESIMSAIDSEKFYASLDKLGYKYSGQFRTVSSLKRRLNQAAVRIDSFDYPDEPTTTYMVHPTWLDVAFQSAILAFSAPGDDRLWSLHVPTHIRKIRVNPTLCASLPMSATPIPVSAAIDELRELSASIDLFSEDGVNTMVQVEDLTIKPFAAATKDDDRVLFSRMKLDLASPDGASAMGNDRPSDKEADLALQLERVSHYYLRRWNSELSDEDWENGQPHHLALRDFTRHILDQVETGRHPHMKMEWENDSPEFIKTLLDRYGDAVDMKLLFAVGENIPAAVRGETTILEHMLPNGMLDDFYQHGVGFAKYNSFLASMMKQLIHRYPHAKILEIGAGTGGATKAVLSQIGDKMSSYTYTDVSVGFFPKAAEIFEAYSEKMIFKPLDVEKSPSSQGYEAHSYDIIVASNVLHATKSLKKTMEHTRQLLKPGGYLMLFELTDNAPVRAGAIMGGLPGWWLGIDDGRKYTPSITRGEWNSLLRKTGFAGVDSITPDVNGLAWPMSVMACQAVDERINFLRKPLLPSKSGSSVYIDSLIILGNKGLETSQISEEVSNYLARFCGQITVLDEFPTEDDLTTLSPSSTFLNLVDIDSPIFKDITSERMEGLKYVYELAKSILWITVGAQIDNPYHMSSITFSRSVRHEHGHISIHHLDLSELGESAPRIIAEYLLRQSALMEWEVSGNRQPQQSFMWSNETEAFLDRGQLKIPRLVEYSDQNARLNSNKRVITKLAKADENISIVTDDSSAILVQEPKSIVVDAAETDLVKVTSSSMLALRITNDAALFLGVGKEASSNESVVSLSLTNSREVRPLAKVSVGDVISSDQFLVEIGSHLIASSLIETVPVGSSILLHSSKRHRFLSSALVKVAEAKLIRVSITCDPQDDVESSWIKLNGRSSAYVLRKLVNRVQPSHYLDLTAACEPSELSLSIARVLPAGVEIIKQSQLARSTSLRPQTTTREELNELLEKAVSSSKDSPSQADSVEDLVLDLDNLTKTDDATSLVSWKPEDVTVRVQPIDASRLFSKHKSYILIGLSGQIGQSLCEYMVASGAGSVILTSRNPKVNEEWLASFGGAVKVYAVDVTNKGALESLIKDVRATSLPIGGVANGAMVLHDCLFNSMSVDIMQKVLGPKIDGSRYLDEIFYKENLDFFVMFSSSACIIGNSGQSNYAASNGYLHSLARQRRRRGLAASTFDIGRVAGIGYVETVGQTVIDQITRYGLMGIAETEFRQTFAETILAGYPVPGDMEDYPEAVVTTGLRTVHDDDDVAGPWFENPLFSHLIIESRAAASEDDSSNSKNTLPVAEQLARATEAQSLNILQECFSNKLSAVLQLTDVTIDPETSLIELGIDSLVAVEIRSWFLKELKVDIPVLKIIGGSSLIEVCQKALEKLPEGLIGSVAGVESVKSPPSQTKAVSSQPNLAALPRHPVSKPSSKTNSSPTPKNDTSVAALGAPATHRSSQNPFEKLNDSPKAIESAPPASIVKPVRRFMKSEPLSYGQSRFWFLRLLVQDETTFNIALRYRVEGNIRVGDLERAVRQVTTRHEAFRTCFIKDENEADQAHQRVLHASGIRLERKKVNSNEEVISEYQKLQQHVFDLSSGVLFKLILLTLSSDTHFLLINYHHIIMDGASLQVFLADLEKAYNGQSLGSPPRQFPDFSRAQRQAFDDGEMNGELEYWKSVFPQDKEAPVLPLLPMARITSRVTMRQYGAHQVKGRIESDIMIRIRAASKAQRSTPFHFYLAAFKAMLFSFTEAQELTIGIADANRNDSDVMESIGFFLNLLTLRFRRDPTQRFNDAISEARNVTYSALGNSRLPFDILLEKLNVARSSTYSPFFQAFFDYRQGVQEEQAWGNAHFKIEDGHPGRTAYDITLDIIDGAHDSMVAIRVQKGLYDVTAANLLLKTYLHFIDILSSDTSLTLKRTPLFSEKQRSQATKIGRGPDLKSDWPETLALRIDQVAQQSPGKIALIDGIGADLTYSDMTNRTEAIAEELQKVGLGPGSRVLVFQTAACDWVCSMLAIMRIGGVYVPLDLRNPLPRLSTVAIDCEPSAVLADHTTIDDVKELGVPNASVIDVSNVARDSSRPIDNVSKGDSPAAILYTSGSTGTPKGIVVTHSGLRNEIEGYTKTWKLGAERALQQSAFTFNHSSDQIYTGLVNGGSVCIVPWDKRGDPIEITKLLRDHSITYTKATPSEYLLWMQYGGENLREARQWRSAFGGGENMTSIVTNEFDNLGLSQLRVYNSYGPTEISISSTKMELEYRDREAMEDGRIPCGFSLPNYFAYILDQELKPLPAGMPGELYIGGAGVSRGYLNNKELTSKHFSPNPHVVPADAESGWDRLYRTGDIAHLREDGAMVFHNRISGDSQVKIRGLRIELTDIESNIIIAANGALTDAVVTLREGEPDFLVAHVVFSINSTTVDKNAFLAQLLSHLPIPQYMIPVLAIAVEKLPLSNHSKVDRKAVQALPLPRRVANTEEHTGMTGTVVQLRDLWWEVIGNKDLGVEIHPATNFFLAGGNSLLVIRLQARIRQVFNVTIRLVEILRSDSLERMAGLVESSMESEQLDWEQETTPPTIIPSFLKGVQKLSGEGKKILVTGSTGYIGRRVVASLAQHPGVEQIHCVAVRKGPEQRPIELSGSGKIVIHSGDLSSPLLGLSEENFRSLATEVDIILHLGGARSFWDSYQALRLTNVQPAKELVKLATPNQIPIHYISSMAVLPESIKEPVSAFQFIPSRDGSNGYVAARWATERVLERSAEALGVPSTVYRFFPTRNQLSPQSILDEFVRFVDESGIMPELDGWGGRLDMTPAEEATSNICNSLLNVKPDGVQFVHYENPIGIGASDLRAFLEKERGGRHLERLPGLRWIGQIKTLGFNHFLTFQDLTVESGTSDGATFRTRR